MQTMTEVPPRIQILCLDFDGVLHSYWSGWQGAAVIPDPPVPGAMNFLIRATKNFDVYIHSARSHQWGGRRAMKKWLLLWLRQEGRAMTNRAAKHFVAQIQFPRHKPPAHVTLDDRAVTFKGDWPAMSELKAFRPWNKRGV